MPYLYQCIREAMRVHSPVPTYGRELENEVVVDGVTLKPGSKVQIVNFCIHHNKHVWGDDHMVSCQLCFNAFIYEVERLTS